MSNRTIPIAITGHIPCLHGTIDTLVLEVRYSERTLKYQLHTRSFIDGYQTRPPYGVLYYATGNDLTDAIRRQCNRAVVDWTYMAHINKLHRAVGVFECTNVKGATWKKRPYVEPYKKEQHEKI